MIILMKSILKFCPTNHLFKYKWRCSILCRNNLKIAEQLRADLSKFPSLGRDTIELHNFAQHRIRFWKDKDTEDIKRIKNLRQFVAFCNLKSSVQKGNRSITLYIGQLK